MSGPRGNAYLAEFLGGIAPVNLAQLFLRRNSGQGFSCHQGCLWEGFGPHICRIERVNRLGFFGQQVECIHAA